jgi:ubiquinone/menaquinone biosynthesis C-methylase UbiE
VTAAERIARLLDGLGLRRVHIGAQIASDIDAIIADVPDRIASLTLAGPNRLPPSPLQPVSDRLLIFTGDTGAAGQAVATGRPHLPAARFVDFPGYHTVAWSDVVADHAEAVRRDMLAHLDTWQARGGADALPAGTARAGEFAGIRYRIDGDGPALVLLPLLLAPTQWHAILPALAERYSVISLSGPHLGMVAILEARGTEASYCRATDALFAAADLADGDTILDLGCGSGPVDRWLARRTGGRNRIVACDLNPFLLDEARALAAADGVLERIEFRQADAERLDFPDDSFDIVVSHTLLEEGDADRMLAEMIRVARPGGRVIAMVRAIDVATIWNMPLPADIRARVEAPVPSVGEKGCADASLYRRFAASGLADLKLFPQYMMTYDPDGVIWRYYEPYALTLLDDGERAQWYEARAQAVADGSIFYARPLHCAVGTKPG